MHIWLFIHACHPVLVRRPTYFGRTLPIPRLLTPRLLASPVICLPRGTIYHSFAISVSSNEGKNKYVVYFWTLSKKFGAQWLQFISCFQNGCDSHIFEPLETAVAVNSSLLLLVFTVQVRTTGGLSIGCPSETLLRLKSCEISFVQNINFSCLFIWKFAEYGSDASLRCTKLRNDFII